MYLWYWCSTWRIWKYQWRSVLYTVGRKRITMFHPIWIRWRGVYGQPCYITIDRGNIECRLCHTKGKSNRKRKKSSPISHSSESRWKGTLRDTFPSLWYISRMIIHVFLSFVTNKLIYSIKDFMEIRCAVVGNVDAGKSTLLGVLTHGALDNGRGLAR